VIVIIVTFIKAVAMFLPLRFIGPEHPLLTTGDVIGSILESTTQSMCWVSLSGIQRGKWMPFPRLPELGHYADQENRVEMGNPSCHGISNELIIKEK
jgi:hypothetical protein